jgi:CheY-like chemotaxis protein
MKTVLLIEDSKFLRIANERLLVREGYHVIAAGDGEQAILDAQEANPDLIVLDMLLPKIGGPEVLRLLKTNAATSHIPVIVLSGMSERNGPKLKEAGAALFLEKGPLVSNPALLLTAIRQTLETRAQA